MTLAGFSHLSLSVTDLGRSTDWYCEFLGGSGGMVTFRDPDNIQLEVFAAG